MKKLRVLCLAAAVCVLLSACAGKSADNTSSADDGKPKAQSVSTAYADKSVGFQLEMPKVGEEIAIITTNYGDIYIRFFPEAAPKAVENFKGLIKSGKYDNTIFHRVVNDFMIQGGDYENSNGTGGDSIWGGSFKDEFDSKLFNIRGSLSMANAGVDTNGSQFFINQAKSDGFSRADYDYDSVSALAQQYYDSYVKQYVDFKEYYPTLQDFLEDGMGMATLSYTVPEEVWKLYEQNGGNISLDGAFRRKGGHTVFGQVFRGMDVVDKIAAVEVDSETNKPLTDVVITCARLADCTAEYIQ